MTTPDDAAYPLVEKNDSTGPIVNIWHLGLTKREYFAAMAMQGISANPHIAKKAEEMGLKSSDFALFSVLQADALIAELNKPK